MHLKIKRFNKLVFDSIESVNLSLNYYKTKLEFLIQTPNKYLPKTKRCDCKLQSTEKYLKTFKVHTFF